MKVYTYKHNTYATLRKVSSSTSEGSNLMNKYGVNKIPTILAVDTATNKVIAEFKAPRTIPNLIVFLVKISSVP